MHTFAQFPKPRSTRWLVMWDFPTDSQHRTPRLFYKVFHDEFGPNEAARLQQSVYICPDDFTARRLKALASEFGANVETFQIGHAVLDNARGDREALKYVSRILAARKRGRPRKAM